VVALLFAAFIYFKKPLSLHHAAFIAVMSLFVIVFGALYYFPQLRHGT
jgi:amino acid permease